MSEVRTALEDLDLSIRTWRNLKRSGIDTVEQLTALTMKKQWGNMQNDIDIRNTMVKNNKVI